MPQRPKILGPPRAKPQVVNFIYFNQYITPFLSNLFKQKRMPKIVAPALVSSGAPTGKTAGGYLVFANRYYSTFFYFVKLFLGKLSNFLKKC